MIDEQLEPTICFNLGFLYRQAVSKKDKASIEVIKECFIMAKKMHKRLLEYNNVVDNTTPDDWLNELESMGTRKIWRLLLK